MTVKHIIAALARVGPLPLYVIKNGAGKRIRENRDCLSLIDAPDTANISIRPAACMCSCPALDAIGCFASRAPARDIGRSDIDKRGAGPPCLPCAGDGRKYIGARMWRRPTSVMK